MEHPSIVCHVSFGLDVGGQEKLLVEFAKHADRGRFRPVVVSLGGRGILAEDIEAQGCEVIPLGRPAGLVPALFYELTRLFRRLRPAVVHTHDNRSLIYAAPSARAAGVPKTVHTRHGRNAGASPRQVRLVREFSRFVGDYVCVSRDAAALSVAERIRAGNVRTIYNGIDLRHFAFSGPRPDGPIVSVSRLNPEKDVANLIRAAAVATRQDPALRLEVAGDGPCRPELERLIAELGLEGRVSLLGTVRDIPTLLSRSSLFVLPSRTEGISLTLLEAMARGLPVAATRVGGNPEVVAEGESGLLVPAESPEALARAMLEVRRDPGAARRMGEAGRRRVEQAFDVRRMVAEYERLYPPTDP